MGFRFYNLNPVSKACISRICSYRNRKFYQPSPLLQALNPQLYDFPLSDKHPNFNVSRRWHVGHSHQHHDHSAGKEGEKIFLLGLAADVGLAAGKSLTGYLSGSTAIIADAAHSVSDVVKMFDLSFCFIFGAIADR